MKAILAVGLAMMGGLARPLSGLERRKVWVEKLLGLRMSDEDFRFAEQACFESEARIGDFYAWKMMLALYSVVLRKLDGKGLFDLIGEMDRTEYNWLESSNGCSSGLIVAIPHHGLFVLSILALAERLRSSRSVYIFYESPEVLASNRTFDLVYRRMFDGTDSGVTILHNTGKGIAAAIRALGVGGVVIMMPDVFADVEKTYLVPFLGHSFNTALGAGSLSARTGAGILPVVSEVSMDLRGFTTRKSSLIEAGIQCETWADSSIGRLLEEYGRTARLFSQLEQLMRHSLHQWQYFPRGFQGRTGFGPVAREELEQFAKAISSDPRLMPRQKDLTRGTDE